MSPESLLSLGHPLASTTAWELDLLPETVARHKAGNVLVDIQRPLAERRAPSAAPLHDIQLSARLGTTGLGALQLPPSQP